MCEYKGYEIYKVYKDAGISAKTGNHRPAFEELKEDIRNNKSLELENELAVARFDDFPVNKGHLEIIPKRHVKDW